jgi:hypothetical protein
MKKAITKSLSWFAPFETIERHDDYLIVEGYVYCNESVGGEGGIRLKRSAMEEATNDYMKFGAVREMHGSNAAGTALDLTWDERGAKIRAKIVDRAAREKVEEKVYKGFSVGVNPRVMRGKDVEACTWVENSLVDRPKDPDALFLYRAEGYDPEAEIEVEVLDETSETADVERSDEVSELVAEADGQGDSAPSGDEPVTDAPGEAEGDPAAAARAEEGPAEDPAPELTAEATADEERGQSSETVPVRENLEGKCKKCGAECRACSGEARAEAETLLARVSTLETESIAALTRAKTAEADLARVAGELETREGELAQAKERITVLENTPAKAAPVRFPQAMTRTFFQNAGEDRVKVVAEKTAEIARLTATGTAGMKPEQANGAMARINILKQEINALLA